MKINRVTDLHTPEELDEEVERMKRSPEMLWWLYLFQHVPLTDSQLRTEAYNRLSWRKIRG